MKLNTVILEKHYLAIVVETNNGNFYQIDDKHELNEGGDLRTWIDLLKRRAICIAIDTGFSTHVVSCPIYDSPIVWEDKLTSKTKKCFSFNPKTNKANNYKESHD